MNPLIQCLAVSALVAANENLIESGRLTDTEAASLGNIIGMVRDAFAPPSPPQQRLPTLIISDPGPEFDDLLERVADEIGATEMGAEA
jgi:hypothetical protein